MNTNSLKKLVPAFLISFLYLTAFSQIWTEDFNTFPDGTFNAAPKWTSYATDCDDGGNINLGPGASQWGVWSGQFTVNDIEGAPCCVAFGGGGNDNAWTTEIIDLTGYCDISIMMTVTQVGSMECDNAGGPIYGCTGATPPDNSHDQLVAEYSLDGGAFLQLAYVCGSNGVGVLSVGGLNGNTLQLRVSAANKSNAEYYYFDDVIVNGTMGAIPSFTPVGPFCENDPPANLPTTSSEGVTGNWSGTGVSGNTFDPAGLGNSTTTITFTPDPGQCASTTTMDITVNEVSIPMPAPIGPFCSTDPPVMLETSPSGIPGSWSGPGVTGNMFDPDGLSGTFNLNFTPDPGQCANTASLSVTVTPAAVPVLGTVSLCENDPPYDLSGILDPQYPNGTWTGPGVAHPFFDPSGQNGSVQVTFTPSDPCVEIVSTTVNVEMVITINASTGAVCSDDPPYDLTNLLPPNPPAGSWSGTGVTDPFFDPAGLSGTITVTYTSTEPCVLPAMTTMEVTPTETLSLGTDQICNNSGAYDLSQLADPLHPNGTWSGPGVNGNSFDPAGLSGSIPLTFTPSENCVETGTTNILVDEPAPITLGTATMCDTEGLYDLSQIADPFHPNGTWSGPGVSGNFFNPSGQSGLVTVFFFSSEYCVENGTTEITVIESEVPVLSTTTLCDSDGLFDLSALADPNYPTGTWSGPGVANNMFDPAGLSGNITLTFDPDEICAFQAITTITVNPSVTPDLGTASLCDSDDPFDLNTIEDPDYTDGVWTGPGVTGDSFDPAGLSGNVTLTFTPAASCTQAETTTITVTESQTPALDSVQLCEDAGIYNLNLLLDPNFTSGTWSGSGVVNGNEFDPENQVGNNTVTFTSDENCVEPANTTVEVLALQAPELDSAAVCQQSGLFDLTQIEDPAFPNGTWTGPGVVNGNEFDPASQNGNVQLTFTPSDDCTEADTTHITVNTAPTFSGLSEDCGANGNNYTVTFTVAGGDPASYMVDGNPLNGSVFTSAPIPNGDTYSFDIDDDNGCGPVAVSGSHDCACETFAGTMDPPADPLYICDGESFSVVHNGDEFLQPDDLLVFILHDNQGAALGNIIAISSTTDFDFPSGITYGSTYYVSAVAGSDDGTGNIDLDDGCLSVTLGVAVVFYQLDAAISGGGPVCENGCIELTIDLEGVAPFVVTFTVSTAGGDVVESINVPGQELSFDFCPADYNLTDGEIEFFVNELSDANCSVTFVNPAIEIVTINSSATNLIDDTFCDDEGILVNGTFYDFDNPTGTEIIAGGSYLDCDSIITVDLSFYPPAVNDMDLILCEGSEVTVNGTIYDESNPSGTEIIAAGSYTGCDSTILVDLTFDDVVVFNLTPTLCEGDSTVVNGVTYNEDNPSGQEIFENGSVLGCDSIVNVSLSFFPTPSYNLVETLCTGGEVTVNGTVYDEANPSGMEVLENASVNGCDSIVFIGLTFDDVVVNDLDLALCEGESVEVNMVIYDEDNPTGQEVIVNGSVLGCDSIININLAFSPPASFDLITTLCPDSSIIVNGNTYNENNPSGTELFENGSYTGCDSIVNVDLSFYPPATFNLIQTLCTGGSITINNTVYDENNPAGTEVLSGAAFTGCDSIVFVDLAFDNVVVYDLNMDLCEGESFVVNNTVYDEGNPTGQELLQGGSVNGCDSLINISLEFFPPSFYEINEALQPGGSIEVNGTIYDQNNPAGTEILPNANVNGCDSIISINLVFGELAAQLSVVPPTCFGYSDGIISVDEVAGGSGSYAIYINNVLSGIYDVFPVNITAQVPAGAYGVRIEDGSGLSLTETVIVPNAPEIALDLGDDTELDLGESLNINPQTNIFPADLSWTPVTYIESDSSELNIVVRPLETITYTLTLFDENDCSATDEITIDVQRRRKIFVPNVFSPNGDGINDRFLIYGGNSVVRIHSFLIFDRWGEKVFEVHNAIPNDESLGWDGTFMEEDLSPAVFVYFAEVEMLDGTVELIKGDVTLVR